MAERVKSHVRESAILGRVEYNQAVVSRCLALFVAAALVPLMAVHYEASGRSVALNINGHVWHTRTHQQTVGAFLREAGVDVEPSDTVFPSLEAPLPDDGITIRKALPIMVEANGHVIEHRTHSTRVLDLLRELGLNPKDNDRALLNGKPTSLDARLPRHEWQPARWPLLQGLLSRRTLPVTWLKFQRAVALSINDGGIQASISTVASTIGEALLEQNIVLYLGDRVQPPLGTLLTQGLHVEIVRAKPVVVQVDGRTIKTRTQAENVAQLLSESGIDLVGKDYTVPALDAELDAETPVRVVRVTEAWLAESEEIPFKTLWRSNENLEIDQTAVDQVGSPGILRRRTRVVYEDGQEKQREVVDEWVERRATDHITSYGTKIVLRELSTPEGIVKYWRKIPLLATSYTAGTSGKAIGHPTYGITRLGWRATKGVVAVDPKVVRLGTQVYVPGYGRATAADTGGLILGRRIDLCYDDDALVLWYKWTDVYLLEPVPPASEITWILPDYPRRR